MDEAFYQVQKNISDILADENKRDKGTKNLESIFAHKSFLLLVSGGPDSIFLLHAMHSIAITLAQQKATSSIKKNIQVLHVNYQLRGRESQNDATFIKHTCKKLGIACHVVSHSLKEHQTDKKSYEETARIVRYAHAYKMQKKHHLDYIVTAHHQDDEVETFLLKMMQSSGADGLTAFSMKRTFANYSTTLLRPLLTFTKEMLIEILHNNNIAYRIDSSNEINHCLRNAIRNEVVPVLKRYHPGFHKKILMSKRHLLREANLLQELVARGNYFIQLTSECYVVNKSFFDFTQEEQVSLFKIILAHYLSQNNFSFAEVTEIVKKINFAYHQNNGEPKKLFVVKNSVKRMAVKGNASYFYVYQRGMVYATSFLKKSNFLHQKIKLQLGTSITIEDKIFSFEVKKATFLAQEDSNVNSNSPGTMDIPLTLSTPCQAIVLRPVLPTDCILLPNHDKPTHINTLLQKACMPSPMKNSAIIIETIASREIVGVVVVRWQWMDLLKANDFIRMTAKNFWLANSSVTCLENSGKQKKATTYYMGIKSE